MTAALIVSSPAFVENYFEKVARRLPPVLVAENKQVVASDNDTRRPVAQPPYPPLRIGWFGNLRCERSFNALAELALSDPTLVQIDLRGTPSVRLQELIATHLPLPNMVFHGRYRHDELGAHYAQCHLAWAVDYLHEGTNSDWLLPNRVYEATYFGVPAVARQDTQTGTWVNEHAGVVLDGLGQLQEVMTSIIAGYEHIRAATAAIRFTDLVHTPKDCEAIVRRLMQAADPLSTYSFSD